MTPIAIEAALQASGFVADQLAELANGAVELMNEVANSKITGEEDRYSHTDLWDFNANVEGSKAAIAALRPVLEERDAALVKTLDTEFANVDTTRTHWPFLRDRRIDAYGNLTRRFVD